MTAAAVTKEAASLSFARSMVRKTPSASSRAAAETVVETAWAVAARPSVATVPAIQDGGTAADATSAAKRGGGQPGGREDQAASGEPRLELLPRPVEPPADGSLGAVESPCGLLVGLTLQVAEHDGPAILLGEPPDLLVDQPPELEAFHRTTGLDGLGPGGLALPGRAPGRSARMRAATR